MYEELQEHPLTQAKIINETLFQNTNNAIEKINTRLDSMDERLIKLKKEKQDLQKKKLLLFLKIPII